MNYKRERTHHALVVDAIMTASRLAANIHTLGGESLEETLTFLYIMHPHFLDREPIKENDLESWKDAVSMRLN